MIFSRAGFNALRFAYIVLLAGVAVGAFLVVGSYLYWQSEKKNDQQSQRALQDLRGRLSTATRDRDDLRGSEDTYKTLASRGLFLAEERLDLIEALAALKKSSSADFAHLRSGTATTRALEYWHDILWREFDGKPCQAENPRFARC